MNENLDVPYQRLALLLEKSYTAAPSTAINVTHFQGIQLMRCGGRTGPHVFVFDRFLKVADRHRENFLMKQDHSIGW